MHGIYLPLKLITFFVLTYFIKSTKDYLHKFDTIFSLTQSKFTSACKLKNKANGQNSELRFVIGLQQNQEIMVANAYK